MRVSFASAVFTPAINVRSFFHRLALGAAVLAGRRHARTNWVRTLLSFRIVHFCFLLVPDLRTDDPQLDISHTERVFLYRMGHIAVPT